MVVAVLKKNKSLEQKKHKERDAVTVLIGLQLIEAKVQLVEVHQQGDKNDTEMNSLSIELLNYDRDAVRVVAGRIIGARQISVEGYNQYSTDANTYSVKSA